MNFKARFCAFSNASSSRDGMGCLNSIFNMWLDNNFVQGEKSTGGTGRKGSFQVKKNILRSLLAALTPLSSALSLVFKTIPRSLVVTVGMVWV